MRFFRGGIILLSFIILMVPLQIFANEPDPQNPGVIMKICADDPAFVSNFEGHMYETPLDLFFSWCPEEYTQYAPTSRFSVLIYAPSWNTDVDKIDVIGNTKEHPITIYTNLGTADLSGTDYFGLPCTGFSELGPNTGLFQGNVLLTGFFHDYDGDGIDDTIPPDWVFTDCGSGSAFGEVQSAAYLETDKEGGATIAWEVTEDFTLVKSINYGFREADISFDKSTYDIDDKVTIVMNDLDYMLYDDFRLPWFVKVWSDSDLGGIDVRVWWVEDTTYATPYFLQSDFFGEFTLTNIDESLTDDRLRVKPGDRIYVDFDDYSVPAPSADGDYITVSDSAEVRFSQISLTGITLNEILTLNSFGQQVTEYSIYDNVIIQPQIENHTNESKSITSIILIRNSENMYEKIIWAPMNLPPNSINEIKQIWKASESGEFTVEIYTWDQLYNANPMTKNKEISLMVYDE